MKRLYTKIFLFSLMMGLSVLCTSCLADVLNKELGLSIPKERVPKGITNGSVQEEKEIWLSFDPCGGCVYDAELDKYIFNTFGINWNSKTISLSRFEPYRDGYIFQKWGCYIKNNEDVYNFVDSFNSDDTLYIWDFNADAILLEALWSPAEENGSSNR